MLIFGRSEGGGGPGALLAAAGNEAAEGTVPSDSSLVSSVYFDNSACDVYYERLERQEGARLVRIRWYGESAGEDDELFVERKTHHESWTTDTSVKERCVAALLDALCARRMAEAEACPGSVSKESTCLRF